MEHLDVPGSNLKTRDQVVNFCRSVQERFRVSSDLQSERRKYQMALIDICRRCTDRMCPDECEVKKAYRVTLY